MCRLSRNLEALISWNPVGLFRPVMRQLYLLDAKVFGLYLTGKFNGIRPITAIDEEEDKVLIASLWESS